MTRATIYVADSGNNRIQVFKPDGTFLRQWGSTCKLDTGEGCVDGGEGQFNEPWGIAVGQDGSVYVSDTWNHRIQKFTNDGAIRHMPGASSVRPAASWARRALFYGPRVVAIGPDGNVYVMDTGNKRVQVFKPDGDVRQPVGRRRGGRGPLRRAGGAGAGRGRQLVRDRHLEQAHPEVRRGGRVRGAVAGQRLGQPVGGEQAGPGGGPEREHRSMPWTRRTTGCWRSTLDGTFKATWGLYGNDAQSFTLPTGIAVGPDGKVYVADGDAHRIMVFPPLE